MYPMVQTARLRMGGRGPGQLRGVPMEMEMDSDMYQFRFQSTHSNPPLSNPGSADGTNGVQTIQCAMAMATAVSTAAAAAAASL